jgi:hypothetical protein
MAVPLHYHVLPLLLDYINSLISASSQMCLCDENGGTTDGHIRLRPIMGNTGDGRPHLQTKVIESLL